MSLLRRYRQWHCNTAIKLYSTVGRALTSEWTFITASCLKDERVHTAIRTLVKETPVIPLTKSELEKSLDAAEKYNAVWMQAWNEHALTYEALTAKEG